MNLFSSKLIAGVLYAISFPALAAITPEQAAQLPPSAKRPVNFSKEIKPIFEASCIKCHGRGRDKGDFQIDSRATLLKGGGSGPAIVVGKSAASYLIELVMGFDPDNVMPKSFKSLPKSQLDALVQYLTAK